MLHLDQNHSSLSPPHSKSNLILSGSPRPDQHALLASSWSPSAARDDRPFYQPQQQSDTQPANTAATEHSDTRQSSSLGPSSPGHAEDTKPADPPASTSPTDATEPTSPLTPPPDNTSPAFPSTELPEGEPLNTTTAGSTEGGVEAKVDNSAEVDKASRASTPLSELSSAPDAEDPLDDEKKIGESCTATDPSKDVEGTKPDTHNADVSSKPMDTVKQAINGNSEISQAQPAPVMAASMIKTESSSGSRAPSLGIATPEPAQGLPNSSQRLDPKVMTILDLNAELLKACMEFQTRGISMTDLRAQQFFGRLQNNLGWLAAAADSKPNHQVHPLPQMQPPPAVDFLSMDRIQALYTELPVIFAKDLRRRSMSAAVPGAMSASISNGILKRERHEDFVGDSVSANKRQHTGEPRGPSLAPSTPQSASSPAQSISSSMMPPATPPGSMPPPSLPGPSVPSPSMLPPSMPISMHGNQTDPQLIARERARQAQARQLAMGGQTSIGGDGTRQMSPGSQQGMPNSAGPSSMGHNPQAQMAALNQMGPMGLQIMQALQNPSHQVTQYLHNSIPNFQALPPQQQMSQFMRVQQLMRRQQAVQAAQAGSHSMGGMQPGGGPQGMMGGNMVGGSMGLSNESPTRMSPTGHQFPTGSTGGGMSPSNPMSGLTAAQQNNLQSLTPVQKQQLMMLQQHQQMRSGNVNPNMLNQQALTMQQQHQQRIIQQMASSAHVGSPMLGGTADGGNFPPSLRSNPSVPGIARSTRTPSDHSQSPMTPQLSQLGGQRGMNQLPQAGMGGNMNQSWPQNSQMGQGQGYGMSPPNSAGGFGGMSGGASSPMSNQQWNQNSQMMFSGGMGNQQLGDIGGLPISRQTSATPVPQPQLAQNSPMGDGAGMNDFDIFNWTQ